MSCDLRSCAARMIISGYWNTHTNKAIRDAWGWNKYPDHMIDYEAISATMHYRDTGELKTEVARQLDELINRDVFGMEETE